MKIKLCAFILAVTVLFTACGKAANPSESNATSAGEKVTIRMIESLTSPERTAVLRAIADKFEEENKNVKVEIISPPLEGADQKISQMLMAKQMISHSSPEGNIPTTLNEMYLLLEWRFHTTIPRMKYRGINVLLISRTKG